MSYVLQKVLILVRSCKALSTPPCSGLLLFWCTVLGPGWTGLCPRVLVSLKWTAMLYLPNILSSLPDQILFSCHLFPVWSIVLLLDPALWMLFRSVFSCCSSLFLPDGERVKGPPSLCSFHVRGCGFAPQSRQNFVREVCGVETQRAALDGGGCGGKASESDVLMV